MGTRTTPRSRLAPAAPLVAEIAYADPADLFAAFAGDRHAILLDSAGGGDAGRWSFIAAEPFRVLTASGGRVRAGGRLVPGDPFEALRRELARYPTRPAPGPLPFCGGAVGYLGYELGACLERVPLAAPDPLAFPDMAMMLCDVVVALDHVERRGYLVSSGHPARDPAAREARARERLEAVRARLRSAPAPGEPARPRRAPRIEANFTRPAYEAAVGRVIDYILAGDIFQANLAQRFACELPAGMSPLDLHRRLRAANPAPFAALLQLGELALVSSSPERFLRLAGDRVETRPIKGTRPRGATPAEDRARAAELLASDKDRAENVMIVDLLRNDLSRVCRDGGVEVPRLCGLESFATVHHLVSTVTGRLRPEAGAIDLLRACFPGGSITGAPKIRAMEVIAELEPTRRGPYCGSVAYLGFDGALDSSIVIRTFALRGRRISFHAGGGIVAASRPADEYDETIAKARALVEALSP